MKINATAMSLSCALALLAPVAAQAASAQRSVFDHLPDGTAVEAVTLTNSHGISARVVAWGAMLQSLITPDRKGRPADIVLAYPDMAGYLAKPQHFGATVGRFANRIANATFTLDGRRYELSKNDGPNSLHGGTHGFDAQLWTITQVKSGPTAQVTLTLTSPDGQEGYPGTLQTSITYALDDNNHLTLTYAATTDKPTVVNLTNHAIFNLAGAASGRSAMDERLTIAADGYTPVDATLIPTGEIRPVAGTPFDFRSAHVIGAHVGDGADPQIVLGHGYDHNYVLTAGQTTTPHFAARLSDPVSGRSLEILTTEPGLQFYSGNFLDGTVVGVGHEIYRQGDGVALEAQHFPNSPNQASFPSVRLDPGQTYRQVTVWRLSTAAK